jgi:hypothetical protein
MSTVIINNNYLYYFRGILIFNQEAITLFPENSTLKSDLLDITIETTLIIPGQENPKYPYYNFTFLIRINNKTFIISGNIVTQKGRFYPIMREIISNEKAVNVFIHGGYPYPGAIFEIIEQGVQYIFARQGESWNFFYAVREANKDVIYNNNKLTLQIKPINQPEIYIISQFLIDRSDIGNTLFEVKNKGIIQKYEKSCPRIVSVLKGIGLTAHDKLNYIYETENIIIKGLKFVDNIIEYSMVKFLLAKLLYGNFKIKYLLRKYHDKFLKDLENSEFKNFVFYFNNKISEVYNYDQYFLYNFH